MTVSTPATPDARVELVRRHLMASPGIHMPGQDPAEAALASLAAELAENDEWGDEMAEYAREHGLPAALDHMRLIGLANIANDLSRELAATRQALRLVPLDQWEELANDDVMDLIEVDEMLAFLAAARAVVAGEDTT